MAPETSTSNEKVDWKRIDSGFEPCTKHKGCNRAKVKTAAAVRKLAPRSIGSVCSKCGDRTVGPEDLK